MTESSRGQAFLADLAGIGQDLPYSPALLCDLFSMTSESSTATAESIAEAIQQDQGLTAKILALSNSAFYGMQGRVASVARAIALLGLKEVRNLVTALGVQALTTVHDVPPGFDLSAYWEHNLCTGLTAKRIARDISGLNPDEMFTAGLLHDFGKLLTALYRPDDYEAIMDLSQFQVLPQHQAEEEHWGIDHALIGAMTLNSWDLPVELTEPVSWHHNPSMAPDFETGAQALCLADALCHVASGGTLNKFPVAAQAAHELRVDVDAMLTELEALLQDESLSQFIAQLT